MGGQLPQPGVRTPPDSSGERLRAKPLMEAAQPCHSNHGRLRFSALSLGSGDRQTVDLCLYFGTKKFCMYSGILMLASDCLRYIVTMKVEQNNTPSPESPHYIVKGLPGTKIKLCFLTSPIQPVPPEPRQSFALFHFIKNSRGRPQPPDGWERATEVWSG
jgi:hypothetical protein